MIRKMIFCIALAVFPLLAAYASTVVRDNFDNNGPLWKREINTPKNGNAKLISFNFSSPDSNDGKVVKIEIKGDSSLAPSKYSDAASANEIILKRPHLFGTYDVSVKLPTCKSTEEVITGIFVYSNDGSDLNKNGLPDNNEIDIEFACSKPEIVWLNIWTDFDESNNSKEKFIKVTRKINLATGEILQTKAGEESTWKVSDYLGNDLIKGLPLSTLDLSTKFHQFGFEWRTNSVRFFMVDNGKEIELWNFTKKKFIPQNPAPFRIHLRHDDKLWGASGKAEFPSKDAVLEIDWFKYWTD